MLDGWQKRRAHTRRRIYTITHTHIYIWIVGALQKVNRRKYVHEHASERLASALSTNHFKYTQFNSGSCSSFRCVYICFDLYLLFLFVMRTACFSLLLKTKILNTRTNGTQLKQYTSVYGRKMSELVREFNQMESFHWMDESLAFSSMHQNVYLSTLTSRFRNETPRLNS